MFGSEIEFDDRGTHVLKGVPGEWRLFAARPHDRTVTGRDDIDGDSTETPFFGMPAERFHGF